MDGDRRVVVDAEPGRVATHGVVHAPAVVDPMVDLTGVDRLRQRKRAAHDPSAGLVHALEGRVVVGAQAPTGVGGGRVGRGLLDRGDVVLVVREEKFLVGRHLGREDVDLVQHTEGTGQPGGQVQAHGSHRVLTTEVVCREGVVPDGARP